MTAEVQDQLSPQLRVLAAAEESRRRFPSFRERLFRHRPATAGMAVLVIIYGTTIVAPFFVDGELVTQMDLNNLNAAPSIAQPFGTDEIGRDAFVRAIYGGRVSLAVGLGAALLAAFIGITVGGVSGYFGGAVDAVLMRFTDMMIGLPYFFLMILFASLFRPSILTIILLIGLFRWTTMARLVRAEFVSLRERDFVLAARAVGSSPTHIMFKEILPNAVGPVIVQLTLGIAFAILAESSISFLGLGIQPPTPSWGNMLSKAQGYLFLAPWLAVFPGLLIFITVLSFNLLGDGLRDALDPRLRR